MTITVKQCISGADSALRTGQPNLATTYMRRASQILEETRRARLTPEQRSAEDLRFALLEAGRAYAQAGQILADFARDLWRELAPVMRTFKTQAETDDFGRAA